MATGNPTTAGHERGGRARRGRAGRIVRALLLALAVLVVVVVAAVAGLVFTAPGRTLIVRAVGEFTRNTATPVTIAGIGGPLGDLTVSGITVGDREGPWLAIDRVNLVWQPSRLLRAAFVADRLAIGHVDVARAPVAGAKTESTSSSAGVPLDIRIDAVDVGKVSIGEKLSGREPVAFAIRGRLDLPMRTATAPVDTRLIVDALGPDSPDLDLGLVFRPADQTLAIDLTAAEPPGGPVHRLAGIAGDAAPLSLAVKGDGPLDSWAGTLTLALGERTLTTGQAHIVRVDGGRRITAGLNAPIAFVLPAPYRPLAGEAITAALSTLVKDTGDVVIEKATVAAAAGTLSATGTVATASGGLDLSAEGTVAPSVVFEGLTGKAAVWQTIALSARVGGTTAAPTAVVRAAMKAPGVAALSADTLALEATLSQTPGLLGGAGTRTLAVTAQLEKAQLAGRDLGRSGAPRLAFTATLGAGGAITVDSADLSALGLGVRATGSLDDGQAMVSLTAESDDLAPFGTLAGQPLTGGLKLALNGDGNIPARTGNLHLDLSAKGLKTGLALVDGLAGAGPRLSLAVSAAADHTVTVEALALEGAKLTARADGRFGPAGEGVKLKVSLADLSLLTPTLAGKAALEGTLSGTFEAPRFAGALTSAEIVAASQRIAPFRADIEAGRKADGSFDGRIALGGSAGGQAITGTIDGAYGPAGFRLAVDRLALVGLSATGSLSQTGGARPVGRMSVQAADVAPALALAGLKATGSFTADVDLGNGGADTARARVSVPAFALPQVSLSKLTLDATVSDPLRAPAVTGTVTAERIAAGGQVIEQPRIRVEGPLERIATQLSLRLQGAAIAADAVVSLPRDVPPGRAVSVALSRFSAERAPAAVRLTRPGTVVWKDDVATLDLALGVSDGAARGTATVAGRAGAKVLALDVGLENLPLGLAGIVAPDLGLSGTLAGRARLAGSPTAPKIDYDLAVRNARLAAMPQTAPAINVTAKGTTNGQGLTVDAALEAGTTRLKAQGTAPLSATGPFSIRVGGNADLALVNQIAPSASRRLSGQLSLDGTATGTAAAPRFNGQLRISNVAFSDVMLGLDFRNIGGVVRMDGTTARLEGITGNSASGGSLAVAGQVALDPARHFPADILITARGLVLRYQGMVRADATADLRISGPVSVAPEIAGSIVLNSVNVTVPDRLPSSAAPIDVRHINVPRDLLPYFPPPPAPARPGEGATPTPFNAALNITVSAPNRVFVRGQGIDAEFQGSFRITGTSSAPVVNGNLEMRRGTLSILGQQLTFSRGNLTFADSLDPVLDLVAETRAAEVTARIEVTGRASAPVFNFTSTPELPQDEVLSRLLFNKAAGGLSPGEALALANAVGNMSGFSRGPGLLDRIRRILGLNQLSLGSDSNDRPTLEAGAYATDNVYIGVKQGTNAASTRFSVQVDVTPSVKLEGSVGLTGQTSVGVTAERDY
ncbi:translocation/assembly module TamB domain-containing protein [Pseudoxanthobacter sp.]|uniref:translocation/assembly module TamB domain-containing protein n=1 Tax=Pseudoxanthobacter sp. TaxID=1925742 RepID=UPI002FDF533D